MHTRLVFIGISFSLLSLTPFAALHLSPLFSSSSLCSTLIFFFKFYSTFILPFWLNHTWFKIHTYIPHHCTQKSAWTIFKSHLITSMPLGGRGKAKSRPYIGLQQLLKWNRKDTLFSYIILSLQKHINIVRIMHRELLQNHKMFVFTKKRW